MRSRELRSLRGAVAYPSVAPIDESRCPHEPIHVPGSIQPHGVLIVLADFDLSITHVSANIGDMFAISARQARGARIAAIIGAENAGRLESAVRGCGRFGLSPMKMELEVGGELREFECLTHRTHDGFIVELQPFVASAADHELDFSRLRTLLARLDGALDEAELLRDAALLVQRVSGFDRTMVYRFHDDWHGEVVAESTSGGDVPGSYLGLHFPASDIPEQARRLYLANPVRLIADVRYTPAPLMPQVDDAGKPVDLSGAILRSVSPIHREYLQNMGARASMSISIIIAGRLWGLIACHHRQPRCVDYNTRDACALLGDTLARQIQLRNEMASTSALLHANAEIEALSAQLAASGDLVAGFEQTGPALLALFGAQGLVLKTGGNVTRVGTTPAVDGADRLVTALQATVDRGVAANHALGQLVPHWADDAAGGLLVTFSGSGEEYVLFTRPEVRRTVNWGGDVRTCVHEREGRLHPRDSFAAWRETVRGQSRPWSTLDILNAQRLRQQLHDVRGLLAMRLQLETANALETVVAATQVGTWQWNMITNQITVNQHWAQQLGYTRKELEPISTATFENLVHPDDIARVWAQVANHVEGRAQMYDCEFRMKHRDGHWVWLLDNGRVMQWSVDGKPEIMFGLHQDISHRKEQQEALRQSEAALRKSEAFLNRTGAVAGVGGWEHNLVTDEVYLSDQSRLIAGVSSDFRPTLAEAEGFYAPEARPVVRNFVERAIALGEPWDIEVPFERADGRRIWVRSVGTVETADGKPTSLIGAIQDVTDKVAARRALQALNERFALATDSGGIGIYEWDFVTGELTWDATMRRHYGLEPTAPLPSYGEWRLLVHPEDLAGVEAAALRATESGQPLDTEFRIRWPDGSVHYIRAAGRVTFDSAGRPACFVGANWDVTEQHRLADQIADQHEQLRKAHDFLERIRSLSGVGGWELDLRTNELYWSEETRRIHGVSADYTPTVDKAIGFYAPEAQPAIARAVEAAATSGTSYDLVLPLETADGRSIWIRTVGSAEFVDGEAVRLTGAIKDYSQQVIERERLLRANERFALAADSGRLGIVEWESATGSIEWNSWMYRLLGREPCDTPPTLDEVRACVHPDDVARVEEAVRLTLTTSEPLNIEYRVFWPDRTMHYVRSMGNAAGGSSEGAIRFIAANWDVTEQRKLTTAIESQHELLRVTLESIGDGVITTDAGGKVTWLNPVAESMTGWSAQEAREQPIATVLNIVNETSREPVESPVTACLERGTRVGLANHTILVSRSGGEVAIEDSVAPIRDDRGEMLGAVLVFHDVTEQRRLSGEASHRAAHDTLTGLPNRAAFNELLDRSIAAAKRDGTIVAVLFVDLNKFKAINDSFGHAAGDRILQTAADRMKASVRCDDFVARLGGDEFVIVLPELLDERDSESIGQKVIVALGEPIALPDLPDLQIGASIGIALYPNDATDVESILAHADRAMYRSKKLGRSGVTRFGVIEAEAPDGASALGRRIARGLERGEFVPYYQPIADLRTGRLTGVEALARWNHPRLGVLTPDQFLAVADDCGAIFRLGDVMLRSAIVHAARWRATVCPELRVSVNVSPRQFSDDRFSRTIHDLVSGTGAAPESLRIELTEDALFENSDRAIRTLREVSGFGIRIAIDDFGMGYSSLSRLQHLPVHMLKIDKAFVREITEPGNGLAIVRAIIAMAHSLGLVVVAEGVETAAQQRVLRNEGCDEIQGYVISEALNYAETSAFIAGNIY